MTSNSAKSPSNSNKSPLMPILNARVKVLVDRFAGGNVSKFVAMLNEAVSEEEQISQQRFNRIFHIDGKTQKYPKVPTTITTAITRKFVNVSSKWLLSGDGHMLIEETAPFDADDPVNVERAKVASLERNLALALSMIYELKGRPRSYEECLEDIDNDTTVILTDLRRSGKKKDRG